MEVDPQQVEELKNKIINHEAFGKPYKWSARDFELGDSLGRGKFGRVHIAREKKSGLLVAIKTMFKSQITKAGCEKQVMREIEIQSRLKHENILRLFTWFHDEKRIFLVLEYAAGELKQHLECSPHGRFPENKAARYIYQVADAVDYCHQHHVIHRDIKPANILVTLNGDIKLADFGLSVHAPSERRKTRCGTVNYFAPEIVKGKVYDVSVDRWSIGVLLYVFLVGKPPFQSETRDRTFARILAAKVSYPGFITEGAKDLISKLLKTAGKDRLSLDAVKTHYWVQQFQNL